MSTIKCTGCNRTAEHDCGGRIVDVAKATGYHSVMLHTCAIVYVCPGCWVDVEEAVSILRRVFPDENMLRNVYMLHLIKKAKS